MTSPPDRCPACGSPAVPPERAALAELVASVRVLQEDDYPDSVIYQWLIGKTILIGTGWSENDRRLLAALQQAERVLADVAAHHD